MNDLVAVERIAAWEKLKTLVLDSFADGVRGTLTVSHGAAGLCTQL